MSKDNKPTITIVFNSTTTCGQSSIIGLLAGAPETEYKKTQGIQVLKYRGNKQYNVQMKDVPNSNLDEPTTKSGDAIVLCWDMSFEKVDDARNGLLQLLKNTREKIENFVGKGNQAQTYPIFIFGTKYDLVKTKKQQSKVNSLKQTIEAEGPKFFLLSAKQNEGEVQNVFEQVLNSATNYWKLKKNSGSRPLTNYKQKNEEESDEEQKEDFPPNNSRRLNTGTQKSSGSSSGKKKRQKPALTADPLQASQDNTDNATQGKYVDTNGKRTGQLTSGGQQNNGASDAQDVQNDQRINKDLTIDDNDRIDIVTRKRKIKFSYSNLIISFALIVICVTGNLKIEDLIKNPILKHTNSTQNGTDVGVQPPSNYSRENGEQILGIKEDQQTQNSSLPVQTNLPEKPKINIRDYLVQKQIDLKKQYSIKDANELNNLRQSHRDYFEKVFSQPQNIPAENFTSNEFIQNYVLAYENWVGLDIVENELFLDQFKQIIQNEGVETQYNKEKYHDAYEKAKQYCEDNDDIIKMKKQLSEHRTI